MNRLWGAHRSGAFRVEEIVAMEPGRTNPARALTKAWQARGILVDEEEELQGGIGVDLEPETETDSPYPEEEPLEVAGELSAIEILIAEDNEDDIVLIREALSEVWDTDGLHVVRDGVEALAYLRRKGRYRRARRPGLVVLDLNMPGKDGFQVLKEMKEDPSLRHIPVIVLTTSDRETDIVRSYSQGACSFITKPSRFDEFREIVEQFALYWYLVARIPTSGR